MPAPAIDALTSVTLKHLREGWWNDEFTAFMRETLRPRPGNRILDVGCGTGSAELSIARLHLSQIDLFGIDRLIDRVVIARHTLKSHNERVGFAAGDACCLPFLDKAFDATFCVAVLQHVSNLEASLAEFARVTREGGRVVAVEPDNTARYWHSSVPAGMRAYEVSRQFFGALYVGAAETVDGAVGPQLPTLLARHGLEVLSFRVFPVTRTHLGQPPREVWTARSREVQRLIDHASNGSVAALGREYLHVLGQYEREAQEAGAAFVEIQNTLLFATVAQKGE